MVTPNMTVFDFIQENGRTPLKNVFKPVLKLLNVSYADNCCNDSFTSDNDAVVFFNGGALTGNIALGESEFPSWPYGVVNESFTVDYFAVAGVTPYINILVDPNSDFGIGGIAWRSTNPNFPYINSRVSGSNAYAAIEANSFANDSDPSAPWTSTIEFYLGNHAGNDTMTPLTVGNLGGHFYGDRLNITIDAHYCLFIGNKIRNNTPSFLFNNITSTFAVDANNFPFTFFNYPVKTPMSQTDDIMIIDSNSQTWRVSLADLKAALALAP